MEYMLTKLDHSDAEAIHIAYGIYEKTINGNYSIADIRNGAQPDVDGGLIGGASLKPADFVEIINAANQE